MKYKPIRTYLEQNPEGDLNGFLKTHSEFVYSLPFGSLLALKTNLTRAFKYTVKKIYPDLTKLQINQRCMSDDKNWIQAMSYKAGNRQDEAKDLLYKWYFEEIEKIDGLKERSSVYKASVDELLKKSGNDLQDQANRLTLLLLEKFEQLTMTELATLKLSLSGIFNISSKEFKEVLQSHLTVDEFQKISEVAYTRKSSKEEEEVESVLQELQEEAKKEEPNFGIKFGEKSRCTRENQIRLVFSYLFLTLKPKKKRAGFDYVATVNQLLDYMLNDTSFQLSHGETQCLATRETRLSNETKYSSSSSSSSSSNVSGRKIDLLLKDEDDVELCAIEFKCPVQDKKNDKRHKTMSGRSSSSRRSDMSLYQEGKSMRINKCIAQQMKRQSAGCVVGVDFNGFNGHSYALLQVGQAHVCVEIDSFQLPSSREELQGTKMKSTLLALYELKQSWVSLLKSKEEDEDGKEMLENSVFFSPKMANRFLKK